MDTTHAVATTPGGQHHPDTDRNRATGINRIRRTHTASSERTQQPAPVLPTRTHKTLELYTR